MIGISHINPLVMKPISLSESHNPIPQSHSLLQYLPLVSREWKSGSNSSYNCTPFLHSLLTKGKSNQEVLWTAELGPAGDAGSSLALFKGFFP